MKDILVIIFFTICIILQIIIIFKKHRHIEIDKNILEKNENLKRESNILENEIKCLNKSKEEKNNELLQIEQITNNMNTAVQKAFTEYCDSLDKEYIITEKEYDEAINTLKQSYNELQNKLIAETAQVQKELDKISSTRAAAIQAQLKEQEIKNKQSFYCPQISDIDLKDVKVLRDIEYKLNNPRVLRMLIWQTYYQKPINQICANVLGSATAIKTGIYKITNQKNNLVYIGQAVDIATRWKNHAKAGLGIDTPANNKLYKSMIEDGLESFSFEVLEECNRSELNEKEKFYIELYQSDVYGFNSNAGISK